jgi:outer membrane lipoprotein-sorting protein
MVPDNPRAALLAVTVGSLLVVSSVATGAAAVSPSPTPEQPSPAMHTADTDQPTLPDNGSVVETLRDRLSSLDTVVLTVQREIRLGENRTRTSERRVWVDYENNRVRTERATNRSETITVRNESQIVIYNAGENTVSRFNSTGNFTAHTTVDGMLNTSELAYEGTEQLDGEQTYRLNMTSTYTESMPDSRSRNATLWVDAETLYPEQVHVDIDSENFAYETNVRFQNVTLNASIPDDRFTVDVPDDAEEPSYESNVETYESLSALENGTNHTVPNPDMPDDYSFEEGQVLDQSEYHSVTLQYEAGDNETATVLARGPTDVNLSDSERYDEVDVGNHTGYYTELESGADDDDTTALFVLPRDNTTYNVIGDLSKSETIGIAESLGDE